jgi:phage repressor protein C with HTH and peptisase S24 domain
MMPTLTDGDDILVDRSDAAGRMRDGIYVLRRDDALMVKRIALNPAARTIAIRSDNPAYPSWPEIDLASVDIIGRVIWAGRRIG